MDKIKIRPIKLVTLQEKIKYYSLGVSDLSLESIYTLRNGYDIMNYEYIKELISDLEVESQELKDELNTLKNNGYAGLKEELERMSQVITSADERKDSIIKKYISKWN